MNFHLIRHGEIESNIKKVYAGWSDECLTVHGRKQAAEAAKALAGIGIRAIYSSPIERAMETAGIIGNDLDLAPIPEESFKELKMGSWEGLSEHEVASRYPDQWAIWNVRPADLTMDGRETLHELLERVLGGVKKIREMESGGSILVVTHVAIIRVLILHTEKRDLNEYKQVPAPENGEIFGLADGS